MRALVQRVSKASVTVDRDEIGTICHGLVVFLGIAVDDIEDDLEYLVGKIVNLRIFADVDNRFAKSALDISASLLIISQFTLYSDTRRGRRPSFTRSASPERALLMFEKAIESFKDTGLAVESGRFQSHMMVEVHNDGPVTIMLDSADRKQSRIWADR